MEAGGIEPRTTGTSSEPRTEKNAHLSPSTIPGAPATSRHLGTGCPKLEVPCDREQRSHISVGMLMIEKPRIPGLLHVVWPLIRQFAESVFTEDRMAVEVEQRAYDLQRGDWNQEVNPVIIALRDLLVRSGVPLVRREGPPHMPADPGVTRND